ncbi:hypothetical protein LTT66_01230 [Nocardia gipuzkoensis]|uniref:hypothetical protein n=1 Tax=Nocardia gipuzkoensis TaxID=2749991 RepID=UPI001E565E2B|nr:hypothetical protein [Nocardia gipuzkoensis]UGT68886.1 hypothetical protein LTT66_01230 [Nocardia gipuzkoensis]
MTLPTRQALEWRTGENVHGVGDGSQHPARRRDQQTPVFEKRVLLVCPLGHGWILLVARPPSDSGDGVTEAGRRG